ncbi:MAG: hypothetical protein AUH31_06165 [Armatimonadetes bacterium 13_1_40CM_64_14]|nr:MAG: hypothetical protein AUH31_06165 [Armatimonadetes bacterium 13_1_40CM_64_14]
MTPRPAHTAPQRPSQREHGRPTVSIIIPCRNEAHYIAQCLDSILATRFPVNRLEVLVVDGRSDDGTGQIVAEYAARDPLIRLLDNPARITPSALNAGIRAARGDIIVRMDAHVTYPPQYLSRLVAALLETGADNVGGVVLTLPANETPTARAIALALSHPLGVGNSYFRIGAAQPRWVDTVPFGCYWREVFDRIGMFDEELVRNQDDEFNFRLLNRGGRILLLPSVTCSYYTRGSLRQIARMFYQYGYFKPLVARKAGRIMTVRQLIPALFIVSLATSGLLSLVAPAARVLAAAVSGSYVVVVIAAAARAARRHGIQCALVLAAAFLVVHVSYGVGFLSGLSALWRPAAHRARRSAAVPLSR